MPKQNRPPEPSEISVKERPIPKPIAEDGEWTFSFKFFNQIDLFGFNSNKIKKSWFVSLLERLRDLNKMKESDLNYLKDRKSLRYHAIDWEAKKIPIQREEITWIDKSIVDNDVEFPFMQFHISKAMGRVIGFWYESVFYIVLLDPLHNMQPSVNFNYRVDPCSPLSCEMTNLLQKLEIIKNKIKAGEKIKLDEALDNLLKECYPYLARIVYFSEEDIVELDSQLDRKSLTQIIELGLLSDEE